MTPRSAALFGEHPGDPAGAVVARVPLRVTDVVA
jgi:hypothetical protein